MRSSNYSNSRQTSESACTQRMVTSLYRGAFIWLTHLVGCFGFNDSLRQYFSLYRAVSQRWRRKRKIGYTRVNIQAVPHLLQAQIVLGLLLHGLIIKKFGECSIFDPILIGFEEVFLVSVHFFLCFSLVIINR